MNLSRLLFGVGLSLVLAGQALHAQQGEADGTHAADSVAPTKRLTVAMLAFADKSGDPESAHWRHSLPRGVASPLAEVKALRIYPAETSQYGLRQLKLKPDAEVKPASVRA